HSIPVHSGGMVYTRCRRDSLHLFRGMGSSPARRGGLHGGPGRCFLEKAEAKLNRLYEAIENGMLRWRACASRRGGRAADRPTPPGDPEAASSTASGVADRANGIPDGQ